MLNEPLWMASGGVIQLNKRIVGSTGEPHVVQSPGLLESALERPKNLWHYEGVNDVVRLGCSVLFGLARNHPFLQGNKRTAFSAMVGFFGANGYRFQIQDSTASADFIVAAIEGAKTDEEFEAAIRPAVVPVPRPF